MKSLLPLKIAMFSLLPLLALAFSMLAPGALGQNQATGDEQTIAPDLVIPDQFIPLYQDFAETLRQAGQAFPFEKAQVRPLVVPSLVMASSMYGLATQNSQRWKDLLDTLDAFKAMRAGGVHILILAPDLFFDHSGSMLDFYRRLAAEVRSRKMKLYIEHFIDIPFEPNIPSQTSKARASQDKIELHDDAQSKQEFLEILDHENTLIYREIKPDYLTLIDEPRDGMMQPLHLSFSADELASWIGTVTTRLKRSGDSPKTLLGAGALTWEPEEFALQFAKQENLDYVDFHFYSLKIRGEDQALRLESLVRKIRAARPGMRITIGEAWLMKTGARAPKAQTTSEMLIRNNFSFWQPLDEQFLAVLMGIAQKENISAVVPFFSQQFFTYYTIAEASRLPQGIGSNMSAVWDKALESIRSRRLSSTGRALSTMLDSGKN